MRNLSLPFLGLSLVSLSLLASCKKTETDNLSRVKTYPAITLLGDAFTIINVGEAYTDPGVTAVLGGQSVTPIISNPLNVNRPGLYNIVYKSANTEGDTVAVNRTVVVTDPIVNTRDQSGNFVRSGNAVVVTKVPNGKGLYHTNNVGGVASTSVAFQGADFVQITANSLIFPTQDIGGVNGTVSFSNVTSTFDAMGKLTSFAYTPAASGVNYGTAVRTFTRVP